jgi:hypothetical protein
LFSITVSIANKDIQADEKLQMFTRWLDVVLELGFVGTE